ncbi:hypothetical protein [Zooshikella harenae]|uniref:Uncharacterized protein n=1 Tax=Zooshikella harenae TaxID=2827238 RepID=A0ABS5Z673_9GAMM|nr:hypothetical protein [Zooshikella harenae]MBU2709556.1 hypothetical protein [Zooshikella harenae]
MFNITDKTYNPIGLSEQDKLFDTSYDDVLLGKIEKGEYYPAIISAKRVYRPIIHGTGEILLPFGYRDRSFRLIISVRNKDKIGGVQIKDVKVGHHAYFLMENHGANSSAQANSDASPTFVVTSNNAAGEVSISTITGDLVGHELFLQSHQSEYAVKNNNSDEELFSMGIKTLTSDELKNGLTLKYSNIESASIVFEVF